MMINHKRKSITVGRALSAAFTARIYLGSIAMARTSKTPLVIVSGRPWSVEMNDCFMNMGYACLC